MKTTLQEVKLTVIDKQHHSIVSQQHYTLVVVVKSEHVQKVCVSSQCMACTMPPSPVCIDKLGLGVHCVCGSNINPIGARIDNPKQK